MDDPSLLPFLNNNGNGHHYSGMENDLEHQEDEYEEDDLANDGEEEDADEEENPTYPEDEIEEDEIEEDEIDEEEIIEQLPVANAPPPPPPPTAPPNQSTSNLESLNQSERGGRRKGVPRRLQISPQLPPVIAPATRLLPSSVTKNSSFIPIVSVVHHSDQEDDDDPTATLSLPLQFLSEHLNGNSTDEYDENNNHHYYEEEEEENPLEIVDDLLAELVNKIVQDIRDERKRHFPTKNIKSSAMLEHKINGHSQLKPAMNGVATRKPIEKIPIKSNHHGKHLHSDPLSTNSIKSSKSQSQQSLTLSSSSKSSDSSTTLFNELTKMMQFNVQQQTLVKSKHSLSPSSSPSSSFSGSPSAKRQKITEASSTSLSLQQQQHQQLLLQMTQQLLMSTQGGDIDSSSLLKQQLLGFTPPVNIPTKRSPGRPPKQASQPQVMRSSTNMLPSGSNVSSFDRANFAPRRRGRPPKYVTERGGLAALPTSHELDPSSYDQLFAAIENNAAAAGAGRVSSAAFQSALASMLGHQAGLTLPPPLPPPSSAMRNGTPASLMKQSAGQTRQNLPNSSSVSKAAKLSQGIIGGSGNALDMPLMAAKKRGPGRPPKNQSLVDSHQVLQATKRMNSSSASNHNFPPTMVPSSASPFDLNAALAEMFQQQQHPR